MRQSYSHGALMKTLLTATAMLFTLAGSAAAADAIPSGWQARDVQPVAYLNLKAQRGFKLTMKKTDAGRWYLFVGTTNPGGFHVIDVTEPAKPTIAKVIESERGSAQITSSGDLLLLGAQLPFTDRGTPRPFRQPAQDLELVTLWDIKDPLNPQRLSGFSARGAESYAPGIVNLDVHDAAHPLIIGKIVFSPLTQVGPPSMHTVAQLPNDHLFFSTEPEKPGCESETLAQAGIINNHDPANPLLVARFGRPSAPPRAPYKTFCELKGRFGLHNINAETHLPITEKPAKRMFATYFLAGLRAASGSSSTPARRRTRAPTPDIGSCGTDIRLRRPHTAPV